MIERTIIVGVMGGGSADPEAIDVARRLGKLIAKQGWTLLNGGRNSGVMEASAKGAREMGGTTIGILPDADRRHVSRYIDIPIVTGMGQARNVINVLSSDVIIACSGGAGTLSEIALAIKSKKPVILLGYSKEINIEVSASPGLLHHADSPDSAVEIVSRIIAEKS